MDWKPFPEPAPELPHLFFLRRLPMADPDDTFNPATTSVKSGWKSTECIITLLVTVLGGVMASGLLDPADPQQASILKLLGTALSIAGALGYTAGRSYVKATAIKSAAFVATEVAKTVDPSKPAS